MGLGALVLKKLLSNFFFFQIKIIFLRKNVCESEHSRYIEMCKNVEKICRKSKNGKKCWKGWETKNYKKIGNWLKSQEMVKNQIKHKIQNSKIKSLV